MTLALEIIGPQAAQLGASSRKEFAAAGGTIGRSPENDWVIPDPFISGRHARIHYRDGRYLLEDISINGVFVNTKERRLSKGEMYVLRSGERFFIDAYEIKVTIGDPLALAEGALTERMRQPKFSAVAAPIASRNDPSLTLPLRDPAGAVIDALMPEDIDALMPEDCDPVGDYDPIWDAHTVATAASSSPPPAAASLPSNPVVKTPRARKTSKAAKPVSPVSAVKSPSSSNDAGGSIQANLDFAALLTAAGIPEAQLTPELSRNLGQVLHVVVAGLVDVLRSREQIKDEFGMRATRFKPVDNNPLKFSANAADALHNLFVKHNAAYLGPVEAFEDALIEVRNHQVAMLAALRVVFRAMLTEFEPRRLQDEFDRQSKNGLLLAMPAKLRYWESYREKFRHLADDPDGSFRDRFGDKFAEAYAEQLERLKAGPRKQK